MTDTDTLLPAGFESLHAFVGAWAIEGSERRHRRRVDSRPEEREAFFHAVRDVLPAALAHLDSKPLAELGAAEQRLMNLLLTFAHVAQAVELQRDHEPMHAIGARRITITKATADLRS